MNMNIVLATAHAVMVPDPPVLHPTSTLFEAAGLMAGCGQRHAVVVDQDRRVVGLLDEQAVEAFLGGRRPVLHGQLGERLRAGHVADVMRGAGFIAREQTQLYELALELACRNLELIPVVDDGGRLTGVVWPCDLEERLGQLTWPTGLAD
jgi:CBS domain-containing protein